MSSESTPPTAFHAPVDGTIFHGDGREQQLRAHLQSRAHELSGNPQRVLDAMDAFGKDHYLMNVGSFKGQFIEDMIRQKRPKLALELGAYVGYSAIAFARHINSTAGPPPSAWTSSSSEPKVGYISLERSEEYAHVARAAIDLAGLGHLVRVLVGESSATLRRLREILALPAPIAFDFVFLDHYKPLYTTDLKILESSGLIGPGTTIVADNVIKPGNPTYLAYVRASTAQKRAARAARTSVLALAPDLVHAEEDPNRSKRNMSNGYEGDEQPVGDDNDEGDWRLVYKSRIVESWDPYTAEKDGVEISEIVGREG